MKVTNMPNKKIVAAKAVSITRETLEEILTDVVASLTIVIDGGKISQSYSSTVEHILEECKDGDGNVDIELVQAAVDEIHKIVIVVKYGLPVLIPAPSTSCV